MTMIVMTEDQGFISSHRTNPSSVPRAVDQGTCRSHQKARTTSPSSTLKSYPSAINTITAIKPTSLPKLHDPITAETADFGSRNSTSLYRSCCLGMSSFDVDHNIQFEDSSDEDVSSLSRSSSDIATAFVLTKIVANAPHPEQYEETMLSALPVAMATSEAVAPSWSLPTATAVDRIKSAQELTHRSARCISVKVHKGTKDSKLGIRLNLSNDGHLQLSHVSGLLKESPLRAGDELVSINAQDVSAWTTTKALQYLRDSWGWVTLTVRNPKYSSAALTLASVYKSSLIDELGISFSTDANKLIVESLNDAGMLGGRTSLRIGDVVLSINSISCVHLDNTTAVDMIRSNSDWVNILVRRPALRQCEGSPAIVAPICTYPMSLSSNDDQEPSSAVAEASEVVNPTSFDDGNDVVEPAFVSLTLTMQDKAERLGLSLVFVNNALYIKAVGALLGGVLREGMLLLAINHQPTCRMTLSGALNYIRNFDGSITLLARNPHGNPQYVRAVSFKEPTEPQKLIGVLFEGSPGRQLMICKIRQNGLFFDSPLNVGDSILQINNIPCGNWRPKDAVDLVRASKGIVSILVKSQSKMGVVVGKLHTGRRIFPKWRKKGSDIIKE